MPCGCLEKCYKTGRNTCQDLPLPQDPVLKDIVEIDLPMVPGWHYLEVEEDGEPSIASYHQIVNRFFHVKTWEARRTIIAYAFIV